MDYVSAAIAESRAITTAQASLWHDIITKHQRQIRRSFKDELIAQLKAESWAIAPLATVSFTYISIFEQSGTIYLAVKTPFNKSINQQLQLALVDSVVRYSRIRGWYFEYNARALASLVNFLRSKHIAFSMCPTIKSIVQQVSHSGKARAWHPMVHPVGDRWYVSNIAETMLPHLPDPLDHSVSATVRYANMGIALSPVIQRALRKQYGRIVQEIISHRGLNINTTVVTAAAREVGRYIELARPAAVLLFESRAASVDARQRLAEIKATCEQLGISVNLCDHPGDLHLYAAGSGHNDLIVSDLASRLKNIREQTSARMIALTHSMSPNNKPLWNL